MKGASTIIQGTTKFDLNYDGKTFMILKEVLTISALCFSLSVANANTTQSFTLTNGIGSFAGRIDANTSFTDIRNFTLPTDAVGTKGTTFSFYFPDFNLLGDINFTSISLSGGSLATPVAFTALNTGAGMSEYYSLSLPQQLSPGAYSITLVGNNGSNVQADYGGTVSVTAVPESSGVVAALAGCGVFAALVARRREEKTAA